MNEKIKEYIEKNVGLYETVFHCFDVEIDEKGEPDTNNYQTLENYERDPFWKDNLTGDEFCKWKKLVEHVNMKLNKIELREELAELEHQQWKFWAHHLISHGLIPDEIKEMWLNNFKPYLELSEIEKDKDREWADKVLKILKSEDNQRTSVKTIQGLKVKLKTKNLHIEQLNKKIKELEERLKLWI